MKANILIFIFHFVISFCYYSLKLNKVYFPLMTNNTDIIKNGTEMNLTNEEIEDMKKYIDLPLNTSEINILNESYIITKNIKSELYTIDLYIGSYKQYFRLMISTSDDNNTVSSINCISCNVTHKYNSSLSNTNINLTDIINEDYLNQNMSYEIFIDSCSILSHSTKNGIKEITKLNMDNLIFKVLESDSSGFLNSDLIDGILSLSYNNNWQIPNNNFIMELYNEGKISSPSFSIIITSSNVNRLYLGDIMKNEFVKNYVNTSMNKGECKIIDNDWKCQIDTLEYVDFIHPSSSRSKWASSIVKFDLNEKKLTIPYSYKTLLLIGYRYKAKKCGKSTCVEIVYNKYCATYWGAIYCTCNSKNDFGVTTFYFNNSRLDVDLRDYVYFDNSAYYFKCRVDIALSDKDEFIIGLRGLNNTILSFDLDDRKIEFFHKKKHSESSFWIVWIIFLIIMVVISNFKSHFDN